MKRERDPEQLFLRLAHLAGEYRRQETEGSLVEYHPPSELARLLDLEREQPGNWDEVFRWLELYLRYAVKTGHPGYINRMWSAANLPGLLGEMTAALANTSSCTFETAPVATLMEKFLLRQMLDLIGFPQGVGQMTTGSSNANMIAMMVARNRACQTAKKQGLFGQPELFAFVNAEAHYSFDRAANILGLGSGHLVKVAVDKHGRMRADRLAEALAQVQTAGGKPFFVCATAGTTVRGAYDPIAPLLPLREQYGFWLHCDGAWGGPVLFSPKLRSRFLPDLEAADSFTFDFHKMPGSALMCNVLLLRGGAGILRKALAAGDESYIFRTELDGSLRDLGTLSLQCGRRVDSLKAFLDWKFYGQEGFAQRVERYLALAAHAEERVRQSADLEMVVPRESFNVCFRFRPPAGQDAAALNTAIRARMQETGRYLVGLGFVDGKLALRLITPNPNVDEAAIDAFLDCVVTTGKELAAEQQAARKLR